MKSRCFLHTAVVAMAVAVLGGCLSSGAYVRYRNVRSFEGFEDDLVTLADYGESGRRAASRYLEESLEDEDIARADRALESARRACVRVRVEADGVKDSGTGILIDGGRRVATAGHILRHPYVDRIDVLLPDGRRFPARIDRKGEGSGGAGAASDWCVLEVLLPKGETLPSVETGSPRRGGLGLYFYYAEPVGVGAEGRVVDVRATPDLAPLYPIPMVGRVVSRDPIRIAPVAGAVPLAGSSGGPVLDLDGKLIGLLTERVSTPARRGVHIALRGPSVRSLDIGS